MSDRHAYYLANRLRILEVQRRYRESHRKQLREYTKSYRESHPESVKRWSRNYSAANTENKRRWRLEDPERARKYDHECYLRRCARSKGINI